MDAIVGCQAIRNIYITRNMQTVNKQKINSYYDSTNKKNYSEYKLDTVEISKTSKEDKSNEKLNSSLEELVDSGVITSEEKSEILVAFKEAKQNNITSAGTYSSKIVNPLDTLVSNGVITEEQKSAIKNVLSTSNKIAVTSSEATTTSDNEKITLGSPKSSETIIYEQQFAIQSVINVIIKANTKAADVSDNLETSQSSKVDDIISTVNSSNNSLIA